MNNPLVTIVTPSFNQGRFIRATIESVLSQDYANIDYIIMDGGSTDSTADVVAEYADRLTWVSEKDRGQSHAINKGFGVARGEIVAWINSDDILLPGAVSRAVAEFAKDPELGAVYGEGYLMNEAGEFTGRFPHTVPFDLWRLVHVSDYILQQTVFFRKAVFDDVGFIDEGLNWGMDWDILIRIGKRFEIRYIPEFMGALREYGEAKTFSGGHRRFMELVEIVRRHTDRRLPPAFLSYGADTYARELRQRIDAIRQPALRSLASAAGWFLINVGFFAAGQSFAHSQGLYPGGWAARRLHYMVPAGRNRLRLRGELAHPSLPRQRIEVRSNGFTQAHEIEGRQFEIDFELPASAGEPISFEVRLPRRRPWPFSRRVVYRLDAIEASSGSDAAAGSGPELIRL